MHLLCKLVFLNKTFIPLCFLFSSSTLVTIATTMTRTCLQSRRWSEKGNEGWPTTQGSACVSVTSTRRSRSWAGWSSCTWRVTNPRPSYWSCIKLWLLSSAWSNKSEVSFKLNQMALKPSIIYWTNLFSFFTLSLFSLGHSFILL